jgi:hypothetical protein
MVDVRQHFCGCRNGICIEPSGGEALLDVLTDSCKGRS